MKFQIFNDEKELPAINPMCQLAGTSVHWTLRQLFILLQEIPVATVLKPIPQPAAKGAVLAKVTQRAAERLGLAANGLSGIICLSEASLSRMRSGRYQQEPRCKPFEIALLFVRLFCPPDGFSLASLIWLDSRRGRHYLPCHETSH